MTTEIPLVSVIVDNFNYGRFLSAAVDSALIQSYSRVEVVVVDDGSTDCSAEVLTRYHDMVSIIFQQNAGQG